jgi:hypothetical protein
VTVRWLGAVRLPGSMGAEVGERPVWRDDVRPAAGGGKDPEGRWRHSGDDDVLAVCRLARLGRAQSVGPQIGELLQKTRQHWNSASGYVKNTIHRPSVDQAGEPANSAGLVSRRSPVPSAWIMNTFARHLLHFLVLRAAAPPSDNQLIDLPSPRSAPQPRRILLHDQTGRSLADRRSAGGAVAGRPAAAAPPRHRRRRRADRRFGESRSRDPSAAFSPPQGPRKHVTPVAGVGPGRSRDPSVRPLTHRRPVAHPPEAAGRPRRSRGRAGRRVGPGRARDPSVRPPSLPVRPIANRSGAGGDVETGRRLGRGGAARSVLACGGCLKQPVAGWPDQGISPGDQVRDQAGGMRTVSMR